MLRRGMGRNEDRKGKGKKKKGEEMTEGKEVRGKKWIKG